jgi:1-aminocyclopropane-1-carboxylate deaminase
MFSYDHITLESIHTTWLPEDIQAAMLRLDKLHTVVSGNKWFKLQYNLLAARSTGKQGILTFGGAYSNHIAATAAACNSQGLRSIGIIRGEAPASGNHTLAAAAGSGMELIHISREAYRQPDREIYRQQQYPDFLVVPEGGHNSAGARGCEDILSVHPTHYFTHILCAVGTGTTLAGLINSAGVPQHIMGIPVLKGAQYLEPAVIALLHDKPLPSWELLYDHHLGGYAKITPILIDFINNFYEETGIPTDVVYTGKLMMAFRELSRQGRFPAGSRVLLIHTGGLQGNLSLPPGVLSF